jgi:hypothetical protein
LSATGIAKTRPWVDSSNMHPRNHWCVAGIGLAATLATLIGTQAVGAAEKDQLDNRIASLEEENAALKKRLQIERLERENAVLRKQLGTSRGNEAEPPQLRTSPLRNSSLPLAERPPAAAYAMASAAPVVVSIPTWTGAYVGASFGMGRLRADEMTTALVFPVPLAPPPSFPRAQPFPQAVNPRSSPPAKAQALRT